MKFLFSSFSFVESEDLSHCRRNESAGYDSILFLVWFSNLKIQAKMHFTATDIWLVVLCVDENSCRIHTKRLKMSIQCINWDASFFSFMVIFFIQLTIRQLTPIFKFFKNKFLSSHTYIYIPYLPTNVIGFL